MAVRKRLAQWDTGCAAALGIALLMLAGGAGSLAQAPATGGAKAKTAATTGKAAAASGGGTATTPGTALTPIDRPEKGQELFASPRRAAQELEDALKADNRASLLRVLGPSAKTVLWSGDEAEDRASMERFVKKYDEMHRLQTEPDGLTRLYVGAENWPYPIPLARAGLTWFFDTTAGRQEILYRRVGRNELTVIDVCGEMVAAEKEYAAKPHDGQAAGAYAQRILSSTGRHDGLYWPAARGEAESPLGPFIAKAETEGYNREVTQKPEPFHGYFYRVLRAQGAGAKGGVKSYLVNGRMTGGFAFLAYPAEYRSSGVMTFMVGTDGVVFQKDLGPKTGTLVEAIHSYSPDASWQKAD